MLQSPARRRKAGFSKALSTPQSRTGMFMNALPISARIRALTLPGLGAAAVLVLAAACTTLDAPPESALPPPSPALRLCANWFEQLDAAIDRAGVRDAGAHRIPGFPYLRIDRLAASFRDQVKRNPQVFDAWIARLKELDGKAREYEIQNLPAQYFPLAGVADKAAASMQTRTCAAQLAREDFAIAAKRDLLVARASVPDNYADWRRAIGLYPLASIPFSKGIERWYRETAEMFRQADAETPATTRIVRYQTLRNAVSAEQVAAIFSRPNTDALGIPQFSDAERDLLFRAYAPAFEIETTGEYDRFGPLAWRQGAAPEVDPARPVTYTRLAFTRFYGQTLAQLVYTIWFPERPSSGTTDLLSGRLDGLVFRVTLGSDGAPLVYDTMHACGCYHMFFPTPRVYPLPTPDPIIEWAFVPAALPAIAPSQSVLVRIASRSHYVVNVRPDSGAAGIVYRFADEDDLRALPAADRGTRSAFGPDGIVPGTERGERYLYWPMGIDSPGAMRQWGNHATAFVGRRHFDDADLIERRFEPSSGRQAASPQSK